MLLYFGDMIPHHTKNNGDLGVLKVKVNACRLL